jgi:ATP-binding protein involved in chromosome partitioning
MSTSNQQSPFASTAQQGLSGVKHIIAVASGKGGVGKSTVSTNLAVALQKTGATVGLMDADIYGPSQPGMLGSGNTRPDIEGNQLRPINKYGIDFISMGLLVDDDTPVIWRAPIAMKMIHQFIGSVIWGELDYLLIDLPPGTGDVQLTIAQQAKLSGAIIVTTPQQVALGVARKGLRMFEQVNVPIVGIIENMSGFTCKHCGKETAVFKEGGGMEMASRLGIPYLGSIPLDPEIMMSGDDGVPVLTNGDSSAAAQAFLGVASAVTKSVEKISAAIREIEPEEIHMLQDGSLHMSWADGTTFDFTAYNLRVNCACASCVDEDTGKRILDTRKVPLDIKITGVNAVGRYGVAISFSDGHNTGIYTFQHLKELGASEKNSKDDSFSV